MIVGVAIKNRLTGHVFALPKPARHDTVIRALLEKGETGWAKGEQGFITDEKIFLNRGRAMLHAVACGQPFLTHPMGQILFSEDLW